MRKKSVEIFVEKIMSNLDKIDKKILQQEIENYLSPLMNELDDLTMRVLWLENSIDEQNSEEIFVEYQKKFKLLFWTGDAS